MDFVAAAEVGGADGADGTEAGTEGGREGERRRAVSILKVIVSASI